MRTVRILLGATCLSLLPALAQGAWPSTSASRLTISAGNLTDMEGDGYYGLVLGWTSGTGDAYAQHLNPVGTEVWQTGGGFLVANTGLAATEVAVTDDGLVGGYVAWTDDIDGGSRIYLMRLRDVAIVQSLTATGANQVTFCRDFRGPLAFTSGGTTVSSEEVTLTGNVTFAQDSNKVIGDGATDFLGEVQAGDYVSYDTDDEWTKVLSVVDGEITLVAPYAGTGGGPANLGKRKANLTGEVLQGEFIKATAHLDSAYTEVQSVAIDGLSITLVAGGYLGATTSGAAVNGSRVTGDVSAFLGEVRKGDLVKLDAHAATAWTKVLTVSSNTVLSLAEPYRGAAGSGAANVTPTLSLGAASFASGSPNVGGGTDFESTVEPGDFIRLDADGIWVQVASVTDDNNLVLTANYPGTGGATGATLQRAIDFKVPVSIDGETCHSAHLMGTNSGVFVAYLNETMGIPTTDPDVVPRLQLAFFDGEGYEQWTTGLGYVHPDHSGYVDGQDRDFSVRMYPDTEGGVIIVWDEPVYVNEFDTLKRPGSTWAARINQSGEGVWGNDPLLLYRRGEDQLNPSIINTATVSPDGEGGLWVSGRYWIPELNNPDPDIIDRANVVMTNRLLPSGDFDWEEWTLGMEWDSWEKGFAYSYPTYAQYETNQSEPRVVADGAGGVYSLVKDDRKSRPGGGVEIDLTGTMDFVNGSAFVDGTGTLFWGEVAPGDSIEANDSGIWYVVEDVESDIRLRLEQPFAEASLVGTTGDVLRPDYRSPDENLYAQHIGDRGALERWWDDDADGWWGYYIAGVWYWDYYDWRGGTAVDVGVYTKKESAAICEPWIWNDPVEGAVLQNNLVSVWSDESAGNYDIRLSETGEYLDNSDDPWPIEMWPVTPLTVCDAAGDQPGANKKLFVKADERFGIYFGWTETGGNIYAKHANYFPIYDAGRADPIGPGPDIFPAPPPANFAAVAGPGEVKLSWDNPLSAPGGVKPLKDWAGTMIRRSSMGYPITPEEGDFVYAGPDSNDPDPDFIDTDVVSGVLYYYSAFTFDTELSNKNYSAPVFASVLVGFDDVNNFVATGENGAVRLTWDIPAGADYEGVVILRSETTYPDIGDVTDPAYVVVVLDNTVDFYLDDDSGSDLTNGVVYYYTAFAYDGAGDPTDTDPLNQPNWSNGVMSSAAPLAKVATLATEPRDGRVNLTWTFTDTTGIAGVMIRRSEVESPTSPTDGDLVAEVSGTTDVTHTDDAVVNGTTYYYAAFSYDSALNYATPAWPDPESVVPGDYIPPAAPDTFEADPGDGMVSLSWNNPSDADFTEVFIRWSTTTQPLLVTDGSDGYSGGNESVIHGSEVSLENGMTYYYTIFAVDDKGNVSAGTPAAPSPVIPLDPGPPSDITITAEAELAGGQPQIKLTYNIPTDDDLKGYRLFRTTTATSPSPSGDDDLLQEEEVNAAGEPLPLAMELIDTDVTVGVTYHYWIWAYDDESPANYSVNPGYASETAVDNFPPTISGVSVNTDAPTRVSTISWTVQDVGGTVSSYVEWGTTTGCFSGTASTTGAGSFSQAISDLPGSTTIYYRIVATDSYGEQATYLDDFPSAALLVPSQDNDSGTPDGMADQWETDNFGDTSRDGTGDFDGDGLTDLEEYRHGTDPKLADTDGDGMSDSDEVTSTPPTDPNVGILGAPLEGDGSCGSGGHAPLAWVLVFVAVMPFLKRRRVAQAK